MTLKNFFDFINSNEVEFDLTIDGFEQICVGYPIYLSEEAKKKFGPALRLKVKNFVVLGNKKDYNDLNAFFKGETKDGGRLKLAYELLLGLAGYVSVSEYDRYFNHDK